MKLFKKNGSLKNLTSLEAYQYTRTISYNSSVTLCMPPCTYNLFTYTKLFFTREMLLDFLLERFFS